MAGGAGLLEHPARRRQTRSARHLATEAVEGAALALER
eukprot:COSAG01_NODE_32957_length_572_cov_2.317125_1_plen_37_part_01